MTHTAIPVKSPEWFTGGLTYRTKPSAVGLDFVPPRSILRAELYLVGIATLNLSGALLAISEDLSSTECFAALPFHIHAVILRDSHLCKATHWI